MISAFEVYLVLQMDSIGVLFVILTILFGFLTILFGCMGYVDSMTFARKLFWRMCLPVFLFSVLGATLLPSSKTLAAMMIVPALTSDQVTEPLTAEGRELYALAKKALTNYVDHTAPASKPEPEADSVQQE